MTSLPLPAATANLSAIDDRAIRRRVKHLPDWYFSASRPGGPAHIVDTPYSTLCGVTHLNGLYFQATNMCGNCRRIFLLRLERGTLT